MEVILCPRCEGQAYDVDNCAVCDSLGVLNGDGLALTSQQVREVLKWLKAWQVNFPKYVSQGEPVMPSRYWPYDVRPYVGSSSRPQGLTG